jgi:twitching motility protein PilT
MDITQLLAFSVKNKASDLHLSAGMSPLIRVDGDMCKINLPILSDKEVKRMVYDMMLDQQRKRFELDWELDFAIDIPHLARFRVNAFTQGRGIAAVFRTIPNHISCLEDIHAPPVFKKIAKKKSGLILVTGTTGSGKSTTLAALLDYKNSTEYAHILTIEDPIEFIHTSKKSLINQREVHRDTKSFNRALHSALRADPDTILIGEMRDLETIRLALRAAETGHLVLASLHTRSAPKAIDRIVDVFSAAEKNIVRSMLSSSLQAVISQRLLKRPTEGRVAAYEIMIATPAIRSMIKDNKIAQMVSAMQTGESVGMQTRDQALKKLLANGLINQNEALKHSNNPNRFI